MRVREDITGVALPKLDSLTALCAADWSSPRDNTRGNSRHGTGSP